MTQLEANVTTQLDEGLRIETLLIELSSRFINLPSDQIDREIQDAQRRISSTALSRSPGSCCRSA